MDGALVAVALFLGRPRLATDVFRAVRDSEYERALSLWSMRRLRPFELTASFAYLNVLLFARRVGV